MKRFDFKKINWKDPKMIFPLILILPVIFLGWMIYQIGQDLSSPEENTNEIHQDIADVPLSDSLSIISKSEALSEAYRNEQDFSAMGVVNDATILSSDTTIYTDEEVALIKQQEEAEAEAKRKIEETNQLIKEQNDMLAEDRRNIQTKNGSNGSKEESNLDREIQLYQKILRGEEILTPEEEEARKIEAIRKEERVKVLSELKTQDTNVVEKVSKANASTVFNSIGKAQEESNYIRAMVDQGVKVTMGSRIRFRLLDPISVKGSTIPAGTHLYAVVSDFGEQRVKATITSIVTAGKRVKVNLSVYDRDGIEGFFIPKSAFRDFSKEAGSQALSQNNINLNNSAESIEGVALQTLQGIYQSASSAISNKIRENKAKIKYSTTIYLINSNE